MEANRTSETRNAKCVLDNATLFLCRQGQTWVVVLESPSVTVAQLLRRSAHDTYDARFDLLSRARAACPDATIESTDGALEGADYEWRLDLQGLCDRTGDLGVALQQAISGKRPRRRHQRRLATRRPARGCRSGGCSSPSWGSLSF